MRVPGLAPLLVIGLASCGSGPAEPSPTMQAPIPAPILIVVAPDGATLAEGDSLQMTATLLVPRDWRVVNVDWLVSDSTIAEVSSIGLVRARRAGIVGVAARLRFDRGGTASGMATVHVK